MPAANARTTWRRRYGLCADGVGAGSEYSFSCGRSAWDSGSTDSLYDDDIGRGGLLVVEGDVDVCQGP